MSASQPEPQLLEPESAGEQPIPQTAVKQMTFAGSLRPDERRLRWFIVGWITVSTILNLIDKNTLAILGPTLKQEFGLTNEGFSNIINAFLLSYAVMYTGAGRFVDWIGEKIGMTACVLWWSAASMLTVLARGGISLGIFRFLLGIGEPGNYPAALRATTRWFSKEERGVPIAIWSSGSSVGNLLAPPLVAFLSLQFGWRTAIFALGLFGFIWVLVWWVIYRTPSQVLEGFRNGVDSMGSHQEIPKESLLDLLKNRKVLAIVLARLVSDPVWLFYISWTPTYLADRWGYHLKDIGLYAWIPFLFGATGGVFGGAMSDWLIRRGLEPARARKLLLYAAGAIAPFGLMVSFAHSSAMALALIALVAFVVYIWFINTAALVTDVFPGRVVASILGLMGTAGTLGGIGLNWLAGYVLDHYHSYTPIFCVAGSGHLLASLILIYFLKSGGRPCTGNENSNL